MSVSSKALDHIVKHVHGLHDVFILYGETRRQSSASEKAVNHVIKCEFEMVENI